MKEVWLWANSMEWAASRPARATLPLFKVDGFHPHGAQTGDQKCRAEPLAIDLAVYLVRRLLDSRFLKHSRNLRFYQLFRYLLPNLDKAWPVRSSYIAVCSSQHIDLKAAFAYLVRNSFKAIPQHYTFSARNFFEDKMLRKTLYVPAPAKQAVTAFLRADHAGSHFLSGRGTV